MRLMPVFLFALLVPAFAQFELPGEGSAANPDPVKASMLAEVTTIAPNTPFEVALELDHAPHWHTYFSNPANVGNPPAVEWALPDGFTASPLRFPVPLVGKDFYGYEGRAVFLTTITPPATLPSSEVAITATATWLACKEQCVMGKQSFEFKLATGPQAVPNPAAAGLLSKARAAMPLEKSPWSLRASASNDTITIDLTPAAGAVQEPRDVHFFSTDKQDDPQKPHVLTKLPDGGWRLTVPRAATDALGEAIPRLQHVSGILRSTSGWIAGNPATGLLVRELPLQAVAAASSADTATGASPNASPGLLVVLGLMFVGGLILNLMPCVFPVIGIKIMGFVQQAGHERAKVVRHGLVFTLGVLVSFWILAGLLLAGGIRNWGSQMENPWVVFALLLVMLVFAMNMFGVFEVGVSAARVGSNLAAKQGLVGTFFSGVLATVVATPCTAPVLATGLSAAVQLPPLPFMLAFTLMGLGLSVPYLLLSVFPALVDRLPRPGAWMESFKQGMSFLLFGTVGYLLWIYAAQVFEQDGGQKGLTVVLGLTAIACGLWVYGRWSLPHRSGKVRWAARLVAAVFVAAGIVGGKPSPDRPPSPADAAVPALDWQTWSAGLQQKLLDEGRPVYVDFTARWCATCQSNKATAYTADVRRLLHQRKVATLRADKTSANPAVDVEMRRLGKAAIPVNVLHLPGDPVPHFTDVILTPGHLLDFLGRYLPPVK